MGTKCYSVSCSNAAAGSSGGDSEEENANQAFVFRESRIVAAPQVWFGLVFRQSQLVKFSSFIMHGAEFPAMEIALISACQCCEVFPKQFTISIPGFCPFQRELFALS